METLFIGMIAETPNRSRNPPGKGRRNSVLAKKNVPMQLRELRRSPRPEHNISRETKKRGSWDKRTVS